MMTRYQANKAILALLTTFVEEYPDWRFGQILVNSNVLSHSNGETCEDPFYEESIETLEKTIK